MSKLKESDVKKIWDYLIEEGTPTDNIDYYESTNGVPIAIELLDIKNKKIYCVYAGESNEFTKPADLRVKMYTTKTEAKKYFSWLKKHEEGNLIENMR